MLKRQEKLKTCEYILDALRRKILYIPAKQVSLCVKQV